MCFVSGAVAGGLLAGTATSAAAVDVALVSAAISVAASAQQAKQQQDAAKFNEKAAEAQAKSIESASAFEAGKVIRATSEHAATQRTTLAAGGFDVNRGDAVGIIGDTLQRGALDAAVVRAGGSASAAAARIRAQNARIAGRSARNIAAGEIAGTVLATGGHVSSTWYQFNKR